MYLNVFIKGWYLTDHIFSIIVNYDKVEMGR